jgi:gliding motility-associated-like protein
MRKFTLLVFLVFIITTAYATHQRAGEITYKAISALKYEFTIITYTYTPSPADRPELKINWGDGTAQIVPRTYRQDLPNNIRRNEYAGAVHTFPGQGTYVIWVEDPNRNYGVLNIPNSVNVPFFIYTELVINPFLGPNNSVELLSPPIDNGCVNSLYLHNPGAYDIDGDSLSYKLVNCRGAFGLPIPGYVLPNQVENSVPTTFDINPVTGTIFWDKPLLQGEYNIAFHIEEWRSGVKIGYVTRDMQITILACDNESPQIGALQDTCVRAGDTLSFEVTATDPNAKPTEDLTLRALGGPFEVNESPATFPAATGHLSVSSTFIWNTTCAHVQLQPYQVVFIARDTLNFPQLTNIQTMSIRVIAPPPRNLAASPVSGSIHLSWSQAPCPRTIGYHLYRRTGFSGYQPDYCETGVPAYTGYQRIATIENITDTTFVDNNNGAGLLQGTDYCYMVVAWFADGSLSYASGEVCASLVRDVPVITNVSVMETSVAAGKMFVAWSKPVDHDTLLFPPPYKYVVNRASYQNPEFSAIAELQGIDDTTFLDTNINTQELAYTYRIDMYSLALADDFMGASQPATSMFLTITPTDRALNLSWNRDVPWHNDYYTIFRYNDLSQKYDSIAASVSTFYQDIDLTNGGTYSYFIRSTGDYSVPGFVTPIINFSQISQGVPADNVPPCPPLLSVGIDCELIENTLSWLNPPDCPEDIAAYYIYFSAFANETPQLIDSITDPYLLNYTHRNLPSINGCYQVSAIDSTGNSSERSSKICVSSDSCSNYKLPSVFTPNDDPYNQYFQPLPGYSSIDKVDMTIFNRWGRIVFQTQDPQIMWDGRNQNSNQPCDEGVYFYVCDIYEITLEGLSKRTLNGIVTLMR